MTRIKADDDTQQIINGLLFFLKNQLGITGSLLPLNYLSMRQGLESVGKSEQASDYTIQSTINWQSAVNGRQCFRQYGFAGRFPPIKINDLEIRHTFRHTSPPFPDVLIAAKPRQ